MHLATLLPFAGFRQGALQEDQDPRVVKCFTSTQDGHIMQTAPTPSHQSLQLELENMLRYKPVLFHSWGRSERMRARMSPLLLHDTTAREQCMGQPRSQRAALAPTPRGKVEKDAFIFEKMSFQEEQWNLRD